MTLNVPDKSLNDQGLAQGNGDSEVYKENLKINQAIFQNMLASFSIPDHDAFKGLFAVGDQMDLD